MRNKIILSFMLIASIAIGFHVFSKFDSKSISSFKVLNNKDFYSQEVQPIFDAKCIACHSCYNSPCQLNLASYSGTVRGANHTSIYDFPKLEARDPTRIFIDANTSKGWRDKGFYPITSKSKSSILSYMISKSKGIESGAQDNFQSEECRVCINEISDSQINKYEAANPAGRMPYGLPG